MKMTQGMRWLWLTLLIMTAHPVYSQEAKTLMAGDSMHLKVADNTRILVADKTVIAAKLANGSDLLLKALEPGYTDVWLLGSEPQRIRLTVLQRIPSALKLAIEGLTDKHEELSVTQQNSFLLASGQVGAKLSEQLSELASRYPQLLDQTQRMAADEPMIRLQVSILEIKRQFLQELGINWQSSATGPTLSSAIHGVVSLSSELQSTVNLMQQQGNAKLLANPSLSTQSGESANFLAGGEIPIPQVVGQGMQDVSFREYGIKLKIEPRLTATDKIKTQLSAEISNLDPAVTVGGVPGILSRRTDSTFLSDDGDTLVLSGLMSLETSSSDSELPGITDLPLIGRLFESRQQRQQQTELLILVQAQRLDRLAERKQQQQKLQQQQRYWLTETGCTGLQEVTDEPF